MIVDFHTHIFPDKIAKSAIEKLENNSMGKARYDGTESGLLSHMKESGVDLSVALPVLTKPSQFESVANFALSVNEKYKNAKSGILSFAGIHPCCDDIKGKMKLLKNMGFKGVKIHPEYQETYIDDDGYVEILKSAKDNDLIVVTHAGFDDAYAGHEIRCSADRINNLLKKVPYNKFVLAHYGNKDFWDRVEQELAGKDVYFDTAFSFHSISNEQFKRILFKHGEDKVLFATDGPWQGMKEYVKRVKSLGLDKEIQDKIFYKNALKLLGI